MSGVRVSARQKAVGLALGALIGVVLLEIGLRAGGLLFLAFQEQRNQLSLHHGDTYRILCIGESTTAMGGKDSYPSQLERVLNERAKGAKFSVINKGIPGTITDVLVDQLPENLDRYQPHVVVAMMGFNDYYLAEAGTRSAPFLRSLRIYKLLTMVWHSLHNGVGLPSDRRAETSVEESENVLLDRLRANPRDVDALEGLARRKPRESAAGETMLREVLAAQPDDARVHFEAAHLYLTWRRLDEAKAALQTAIRLAPEWKNPKHELALLYVSTDQSADAYRLIRGILDAGQGDGNTWASLRNIIDSDLNHGRIEEAKAKLDEAFALLPSSADETRANLLGLRGRILRTRGDEAGADAVFREAETIRSGLVRTRTERNYLEAVRILAARGIPLVAVQYPVRPLRPLKEMLGSQRNAVFVDNEPTFREALRRGRYEDYFRDSVGGDFGHTTPRGARLLAENVAETVLRLVNPAD